MRFEKAEAIPDQRNELGHLLHTQVPVPGVDYRHEHRQERLHREVTFMILHQAFTRLAQAERRGEIEFFTSSHDAGLPSFFEILTYNWGLIPQL
jgi:hypothetical protein